MKTYESHTDKLSFDAIIIGFGKAGKTLAIALANAGQQVAVVERSQEMYGGTCINIACIPTKTLVSAAEQGLSFDEAFTRKDAVVSALHDKNEMMLRDKGNIWLIDGVGSFINQDTIRIQSDVVSEEITAKQIFINTGSLPNTPDYVTRANSPRIVTSTEMLNMKHPPARLGIVGGGYIGVEFASIYASFGSKVTILHNKSSILERDEPLIRDGLIDMLHQQGVEIKYDTQVVDVREAEGAVQVIDGDRVHEFDAVLVAVGRHPNIKGLNLEAAGVDIGERGEIIVDDRLQTTTDNIWALGDVNGGPQFTYVSLDDFRIVHSQLLGDGSYTRAQRKPFASTVFTQTPYARIGLTELEATEQGYSVKTKHLPATAITRLHVDQKTTGVLKAVVDADTNKVLGASLFCHNAHEVINVIKTAMDNDLPYTVLRDQIFTHPSVSESLNDLFSISQSAAVEPMAEV